ncbi:MAG: hypothetical protein EOS26_18290 [Mesorhizobium sp.]|nr:MAG: hypothetical protein EOS26_18290 [Mesorhizobium sp.]
MPLRDAVLLSWELRSYRAALEQNGPVFFRSRRAGHSWLSAPHWPAGARPHQECRQRFRYASLVFIAPPWREIFWQDCERRQPLDEAERIYHALASIYTQLGYELVPLLLAPVEARLRLSWPRRACSLSPDVKKAGNDPAFLCSLESIYSAGASTISRPRPSVTLASTNEITAQSVMPATIGSGVPSKNTPAMPMATAPIAKCSVPISAEAVPAIAPCSSMASTEVVGITRPRNP